MKNYQSWGLYPKSEFKEIIHLDWRHETIDFTNFSPHCLVYGLGRSYGDVCLNNGGILLDASSLNHFIDFDPNNGILKCEGGVTLSEILNFVVPKGWFLPIIPGTKFVTVGGAIANDIHGKNHHKKGSFGHFVNKFELIRSNGERLICSRNTNKELFFATIGGLGLTGIILWAELQLKPISSSYIYVESIKFSSIEEFFSINENSEQEFEYTVAWLDFSVPSLNNCRGIYQRGNHYEKDIAKAKRKTKFAIPFVAPFSLINKCSITTFNFLYYIKEQEKISKSIVHFEKFFFPLDNLENWNYLYGKNGFFQYQFVIPKSDGPYKLKAFINECKKLNLLSFLTVIKTFGKFENSGLLSFPREGITLAVDFPFHKEIFVKLNKLDDLIMEFGGALYPAKDSRMSPKMFLQSFPNLNEFLKFKDPLFSSSFWRRVAKSV
ncbi:MAG: FAD-binding oxidoreductase [Ignavibacteria bacterium]|nr:FAD-binding oxidoreductase [Ignavibacteria bacterium]